MDTSHTRPFAYFSDTSPTAHFACGRIYRDLAVLVVHV